MPLLPGEKKITKMERQDAAPPKKPFRRRHFFAGTRFSRSVLEIFFAEISAYS